MTKSPKYGRDLDHYEEHRLIDALYLYERAYGEKYDLKELKELRPSQSLIDICCSKKQFPGFCNELVELARKRHAIRSRLEDTPEGLLAVQIVNQALATLKERHGKYGDSWKCLSLPAMASLIEMKMNRIANLGSVDPKTEDEFIDTIGYCIFGLIKFKMGLVENLGKAEDPNQLSILSSSLPGNTAS